MGMELVDERELVGGDAAHNAKALRDVLAGEKGAYADIVALNAAAALCVAGAATTLDKGIAKAREALTSGKAMQRWSSSSPSPMKRPDMADILDKIEIYKREEIAAAKRAVTLGQLEEAIKMHGPPRGFLAALRARRAAGIYGLIAEIKKASPSKGLIREAFDPPAHAPSLCRRRRSLPVGSHRRAVLSGPSRLSDCGARGGPLPVLRKDFLYDTYQVAEARAWGADCILDHHGRGGRCPCCRPFGRSTHLRHGRADRGARC
jgi:hypothetical protein